MLYKPITADIFFIEEVKGSTIVLQLYLGAKSVNSWRKGGAESWMEGVDR